MCARACDLNILLIKYVIGERNCALSRPSFLKFPFVLVRYVLSMSAAALAQCDAIHGEREYRIRAEQRAPERGREAASNAS